MSKKDDKGKAEKKKRRRDGDTARALLEAVVAQGGSSDVASLCRATDASLTDVLRGLVDLQRFGLVEVTNGSTRPTELGAATATALARRAKEKARKKGESGEGDPAA